MRKGKEKKNLMLQHFFVIIIIITQLSTPSPRTAPMLGGGVPVSSKARGHQSPALLHHHIAAVA